MEEIIEFYKYIEELKNVTRYQSFKEQHENVAGHIFGTMFIAYDLMEKFNLNLDKSKVLNLLLFHDLAESGMKYDIEAPKSEGNKSIKEQKHIYEINKIKHISEKFNKPYILNLFEEFENKQTREARFANLVDKIEAQNHMINNQCRGLKTKEDFEFIIKFADKYLPYFPELNEMENKIKDKLKSFIKNI